MARKAKIPYEEKSNAVKAYLSGTTSIDQIADKYQVNKMSVRMWITNYQSSGANGLITTSRNATYSQELKVKAVEDYLKGKGSQEAICRKYGIRARKQLQDWILKYNGHERQKASGTGGRPIMTKGRTTTFDERVEIVKYCIDHNNNYNETAEKFNISYQQARGWTVKYQESGINALQDRRGKRKSVDEMSEIEKLKAQNKLLEAQKRRLELENEFLKKTQGIRKGLVISLVKNENSYKVIKFMADAGRGTLIELCEIAGISRAGYYKWLNRKKSKSELTNESLLPLIREAYEEKGGILGYRQMTIKLYREHELKVNHKRVYRLMKVLGLKSVCRKKNIPT